MTTMLDRSNATAAATVALVRHLNSRGFTVDWIAEQIAEPRLPALLVDEVVDEHTYRHVEAICRGFGYRYANPTEAGAPDTGYWTSTAPPDPRLPEYDVPLPWRERAQLPGFDCYGRFDQRFLPGHVWAKADDLVGRLHDALRLILSGVFDTVRVEAETGVYPEQQQRLRRRLGLRLEPVDVRGGPDGQTIYRLIERHPAALDDARAVLARMDGALEAEDDTLIGVALEHGVVATFGSDAEEGTPRIVNDHPAVVAWRRARAKATITAA